MNFWSEINLRHVFAVWMRNVTIYKRSWLTNLLPNFFEPLLYLFGMGVGLGGYLHSGMNGASYLSFIAPGLVAAAAMNGASFEVTYNVFVRMHMSRLYNAYLCTPATVVDVILGELFWATTRAFLYGLIFFLVLFVFQLNGDTIITSPLAVFVPAAIVLIGALFSVIGLLFTAIIKSIDLYSYYFTLFLTPLFLFSGIFYPVDRFPHGATIAWCTPLYHGVRLMKGLMRGPFGMEETISLAWLIIATIILYALIPQQMRKKLVS